MKVGIIGAGIAGLASAVRMASKGHEVSVFEMNESPGGKLSSFNLGQYRFDLGPSLFTMPQYVVELFELANAKFEDYFTYFQVPVVCNYFWQDGTQLKAYSDHKKFADSIHQNIGPYSASVERLLLNSQKKYALSGKIFLEKSLHKMSTWLSKEVLVALSALPSFHLFSTMDSVHRRYLPHPKLVQLFNRFATYNGSNPFLAPGMLTMIPHFEHGIGTFFPAGGMTSIAQSIYKLGKDMGVNFHFQKKVDEIIVENRKATSLRINNEVYPFDCIISNMDIFFVYEQLLPGQKKPKKILSQEKSTSALIFYWGIKKTFPELDLHNIFFSEDYQAEFNALQRGKISDDPTIYINITSKYNTEDAPFGTENWFTMINAPFNNGQNWNEIIKDTKKGVIQKLNRMLHTNLEDLIEEEYVLDPTQIESKTLSHLGALYGTSSNSKMAAFLRHPNFSSTIKNLYFTGGSVHPGGGIPLCLQSAKIVDQLIHS